MNADDLVLNADDRRRPRPVPTVTLNRGDLVRRPDCDALPGDEECSCFFCHYDVPHHGVVIGYNLEESVAQDLWDVAFGEAIWPMAPEEVEVIDEDR
jgi:hypothetical protein